MIEEKEGVDKIEKVSSKLWRESGENTVTELKRNNISRWKELLIKYRIKVKEENRRKYSLNLRINVIGIMFFNNLNKFLWFIMEGVGGKKNRDRDYKWLFWSHGLERLGKEKNLGVMWFKDEITWASKYLSGLSWREKWLKIQKVDDAALTVQESKGVGG